MHTLRSPGGCPWDAKQTHASLVKYLLEEAYETAEAIEQHDDAALREELGDVLLQVVFHARIAQEAGGWDIDDVAGDIVDKLVRRHPHVFAGADADSARDQQRRRRRGELGEPQSNEKRAGRRRPTASRWRSLLLRWRPH